MTNLARLALVEYLVGHRIDQADLAVRASDKNRSAIGSDVATVKTGGHIFAANGRKIEAQGCIGNQWMLLAFVLFGHNTLLQRASILLIFKPAQKHTAKFLSTTRIIRTSN
jgi:hypothetical protein